MSSIKKIFEAIIDTNTDANIRFEDVGRVLRRLGFDERIRGSHHLYTKAGVDELINLQRDGSNLKGYQVRQLRAIIKRHRFRID